MKYLTKSIIFLFIFSLLGCLQGKKEEKDFNQRKRIEYNKSEEVVLIGTSDDPDALEYFNVINNSYLIGKNHIDSKKTIINDSLNITLNSISDSKLMEIIATSEQNFYKAQIYVSPGDTIIFEIKNKELIFKGRNSDYNNFYSNLYKSTPYYYNNSYEGDIYDYKKTIESIYKTKINFLENFIKTNKSIDNDFLTIVKNNLEQEYLNELINPRSKKIENFADMYSPDPEELFSVVQKEFIKKETFFEYVNYFGIISVEEFQNPELLKSSFFKDNINKYIRYYFETSNFPFYSQEKFIAEKKFIKENFNGDLENLAIVGMIWDYHEKGFGNSVDNIDIMLEIIEEYDSSFAKQSYKTKMREIKEDLLSFNFELSDNALNTKLVNVIGDTLTLKEIFSRSSERIKVVDFWATWCPPCITQIEDAKNFKDRLTVENNVEWIYLSIDENQNKWQEEQKKLSDFLNYRNSYFILTGKHSTLAKTLKVSSIPRYVIFNKKNKIFLNSAPNPTENKILFEEIIDSIQ